MRVLVTGGSGFIGKHLVEELKRNGYEVFSFSSSEFDLRNREDTMRLFEKFKPEAVIHLAAKVAGIGELSNKPYEYLMDNLKINVNIMEALMRYKPRKVVVYGTTCSFTKGVKVPTKEDYLWTGEPENTYGLVKLVLLKMLESSGLNYLYLIPANVYGPGDKFDLEKSHIIPAAILKFHKAKKEGKKRVEFWGDGNQVRDFIYVEDLVKITKILFEQDFYKYKVVNVASGAGVKIRDLVYKIRRLMDAEDIEIFWDASKPQGIKVKILDNSRLRSLIGDYDFTDIDTGLKKTVRYFNEISNSLDSV